MFMYQLIIKQSYPFMLNLIVRILNSVF